MKHFPFQSIYKQDFQVIEQVQGNLRLYPHTDQLPTLFRALEMEFRDGLSDRLARLDHRGSGFNKIVRHMSVLFFCNLVNSSRSDDVRLLPMLNRHFVGQISVVQQITEPTQQGRLHYFKFYAGADFFTEICLSGKRILFTDHVLQRFRERVPNNQGEEMSVLLMGFFTSRIIAGPVNNGRGLILPYVSSLVALTFEETDTEFIITTCLTIGEINSFPLQQSPRVLNLHYGRDFSPPTNRNWDPAEWTAMLHKAWRERAKLPPPIFQPAKARRWREVASGVQDYVTRKGVQPECSIEFQDNIFGPVALSLVP